MEKMGDFKASFNFFEVIVLIISWDSPLKPEVCAATIAFSLWSGGYSYSLYIHAAVFAAPQLHIEAAIDLSL